MTHIAFEKTMLVNKVFANAIMAKAIVNGNTATNTVPIVNRIYFLKISVEAGKEKEKKKRKKKRKKKKKSQEYFLFENVLKIATYKVNTKSFPETNKHFQKSSHS